MRFQGGALAGRRLSSLLIAVLLAALTVPTLRQITKALPVATAPVATLQQARIPLLFVENRGQAGDQIDYYLQTDQTSIGFWEQGVRVVLTDGSSPVPNRSAHDLKFVGARPVTPTAGHEQEGVVSYFSDAETTNLNTFTQVRYAELWPGIDLVFNAGSREVKYEFVVQAGADPAQIRLRWNGVDSVSVARDGSLAVATPIRTLTDPKPVSFQFDGSDRMPVASAYQLDEAAKEFGFALGAYDPARTLIIDPVMLQGATFVGGHYSNASSVALDSEGNIYVGGNTFTSPAIFLEGGISNVPSFDNTRPAGTTDSAFILKLNPDATRLLYAGFLSTNNLTNINGLAVDERGAAYFTGWSARREFLPAGVPGPDMGSTGKLEEGGFVGKVSPSGTALEYVGLVAGDPFEIAIDHAGAAYVVGRTKSPETVFPDGDGIGDLPGAARRLLTDRTYDTYDAFLLKVRPDGTAFEYATYLGGGYNDEAWGVAVDANGTAHVVGFTSSTQSTFPGGDGNASIPGADRTINSPIAYMDGFHVTVAPDGASFLNASYIGGSTPTLATSVALDSAGDPHIAGFTCTTEAEFPDGDGMGTLPGWDRTNNGACDGFLVKMNGGGTTFGYAGFIGGQNTDWLFSVTVDNQNRDYIAGQTYTSGTNFPDGDGFGKLDTFNKRIRQLDYDGYVAMIDRDGTRLRYAGLLGGSKQDAAADLAVDAAGNVVVVGNTESGADEFPDGDGIGDLPGYDRTAGFLDGFVVRIGAPTPMLPTEPLAWGWNGLGMLGDASTSDRLTPHPAAGMEDVVQVSAGLLHSLALKSDGTVWAWGWNGMGQLGDGTTTDHLAPQQVPGLTDVVQISAGWLHNLALRSDGTVWAWGWNYFGQLGNGNTTDQLRPIEVSPLSDVTSVSAGAYHNLALLRDGTLRGWGWNAFGQVGDGSIRLQFNRPAYIEVPAHFATISAGSFHTAAVSQTGEVWTWGWNGFGQLGLGNTVDRPAPVKVSGPAGVHSVSGGYGHTLAMGDSQGWGWGWNTFGQLGDSTTVDRMSPVPITHFDKVSAGLFHSLGILGGRVQAWGWNGLGQIGDGTRVDRVSPTGVGPAGVGAVSAGTYHSLAAQNV